MTRLVPFTSDVFCDVVGTEAMRAVWSDESLIGHWRAVEGAVVEVQAEMGWIPSDAAREIVAKLETFPLQAVVDRRRETGHLMVAFLKAFREHCGPAAEHMHVGPTTQDIMDTGLVRMIGTSHSIIIELILSLEEALCARALEHADTPVMGRSHAQHAVPTTFGFLLAGWAQEARDHLDRLRESEKRWRVVSLTAAVGSRNTFVELSDVASARELERRVGEKLGLPVATIDWHARGDKLAEPVGGLASLTSSLAKWALNLRSWQSAEIAETKVPYRAEEYSSSTMPIKRNPERLEHTVGAASLVRGFASAMESVAVLDNRDGTRVPVQFTALPQSYSLAHRSLITMVEAVTGLEIDAEVMRRNLDHPNLLGAAAGERLMIAVYRKIGRRDWAHTTLHDCATEAMAQGHTLREAITGNSELAALFTAAELDDLCDLSSYVGSAPVEARETVERLRSTRTGL
ncbi:MAG: lyase family protein [Acidobacteria bacterium]|nr:lyase family protein [Acidobacteriota bacterium]MDA1236196.1 lyase family protein [Acidobacteriota bacterium]